MIDSENMPSLAYRLRDGLTFPLAYSGTEPFRDWQARTRAYVLVALGIGSDINCNATAIEEWAGDGYGGSRLELSFANGEMAQAYLLKPGHPGPHPAVLLLHDHGSHFSIGKEKMIRPPASDPAADDAQALADRFYGGRHIGDVLARLGYVVLSVDALGWGSRRGNDYEGQQALAANLMQFGVSLASVVAFEDITAARFLASLADVDPARIASFGFSLGAYRAWQVAALSDDICASVACSWMGTLQQLMHPGNNQLRGQSAYYMLHPPLAGKLDYPDIAGMAAPKPAFFLSGNADRHFPVDVVDASFARLAGLWAAAGAADALRTEVWQGPHVFPVEQQDVAMDWMQRVLGR
jgi:dienelactone hydrolase